MLDQAYHFTPQASSVGEDKLKEEEESECLKDLCCQLQNPADPVDCKLFQFLTSMTTEPTLLEYSYEILVMIHNRKLDLQQSSQVRKSKMTLGFVRKSHK